MATRRQFTCIIKSDRYSAHERITHIGGTDINGSSWRLTQKEAIDGIESGRWAFYVRQGGSEVNVIVAKSQNNNKYLKTTADGEQPNNLLSLLGCS
ncbi:MAG: DUF3892 domain-containing protein [Roseiflexaceae bacterium]